MLRARRPSTGLIGEPSDGSGGCVGLFWGRNSDLPRLDLDVPLAG